MKNILHTQLSIDMACEISDITSKENVFTCAPRSSDMRASHSLRGSALHLICINNKIVARSDNRNIIDMLKLDYINADGRWLSEYFILEKLNKALGKFGESIADMRPYFVPDDKYIGDNSHALVGMKISWYNQTELLEFKGDKRFYEALIFDEFAPDVLAVTAEYKGEIVGMAAATADSPLMWEIGINVVPECEGKGIASSLVALIKERIISLGKLPFYDTAMSHIGSQRVALKAGFLPSFVELF